MTLSSVQVALDNRSYRIDIGAGLLSTLPAWASSQSITRIALITNDVIWPLYGETQKAALIACDIDVLPIVLPDGEIHKDWVNLNKIYDALLAHRCDRTTALFALGGGVVGDLVGFAAATYQRGVPFVQLPTTLLAQVDSSVGGKTAVNHPLGKNMIGAFYQPIHVVADTNTLVTLPAREYRSGLAEVIKYGLILDYDFFTWLENNIDALLARDAAALAFAIKRSCEIKAAVVAADERETARAGGRALLNFGHTFGHAIESALGYGVWMHGEAVGCGMALAARLSTALGMLDAASCDRAIRLIERAGLATALPDIMPDEMLDHMGRDKKNEGGNIRLILLKRIGVAYVDGDVGVARIREFLASA